MIDFPVVDTHVHLLDTKRFKYSWARDAPKLGRDWSIADLDERARPYRIDRIVFAEVDVDMPQYLEEAEWVQTLADRDKRLQGCVACLPLERGPAIEGEMERLAKLPVVRGIRRLIQNQPDPDYVLKPDFQAAVKLLPKYNLSFDICIYHHQLPNTLRFVQQCPEVFFVLDHIAKPGIKAGLIEPWKTHIRELAAFPNVMCKLSGVTTEADHATWTRDQLRPYIDHVIDCFGFDRIMYGGDWPVAELAGKYTDWLEVLDWATSGCTAAEKRKLFRDNGIKAYRLTP
jgi:L-fuconolactonase